MSIKSSIILRPILSEKGTLLGETQNKYVFQVEKKLSDQYRNVNDIEYAGGFKGAGLHRDDKVSSSWPNAKS